MKLGKRPARPGAIALRLRKYLNLSTLPTPPAAFGHDALQPQDGWGMLGNDSVGDCVFAGAAHETMLWNREGDHPVTFDTQAVLSDYAALTGYQPQTGADDNGADMQQAAAYRQRVGIVDVQGNRHKIGAYIALTQGDLEEHLLAAYLFGAVGLGLTIPQSAMDQFNAGQWWDEVPGSPLLGGHYVPLIAWRVQTLIAVTWGQEQGISEAFFVANNDESVTYLSAEFLRGEKSLDGFDLDQLRADLDALPSAA